MVSPWSNCCYLSISPYDPGPSPLLVSKILTAYRANVNRAQSPLETRNNSYADELMRDRRYLPTCFTKNDEEPRERITKLSRSWLRALAHLS